MKKIIGTLLLIISLIIIAVSCVAATEIDCEKRKLFSQVREEFDYNYQTNLDSQQSAAIFALFFGVIIFIIGLVLVLTKSKKQKELETEVQLLKHVKENTVQTESLSELERLFELKQKGVLTEEEFANRKKKILE